MSSSKQRRVYRDWPVVIRDFQDSGLSIQQYCQKHKIHPGLFVRWQKRLAARPCPAGNPNPSPVLRADDFIELRPAGSSQAAISIVFPGGIEMCVHRDCDHSLLGEVLGQLKDLSC